MKQPVGLKAQSNLVFGALKEYDIPLLSDIVSKRMPFRRMPKTILHLPESGTDPEAIAFDSLPGLPGQHAVIHPVAKSPDFKAGEKLEMNRFRLQLHNYLIHHDGKFWCIWSDGPRVEDWPTQEVKYSTSEDGLVWADAKSLTGTPKEPYAYIARGLWKRNGKLLALASHYKGKGAFGKDKELKLQAYQWMPELKEWKFAETVFDDAINNFPPQSLPDGNWIMTRRDSRFNVSILVGGKESLSRWNAYPVVRTNELPGFRPDEPVFWQMPDQSLNALFRDNGGSRRLFHATSRDRGKELVQTGSYQFSKLDEQDLFDLHQPGVSHHGFERESKGGAAAASSLRQS